jgi:methylmalonyl-CoA mutase N-terminal domain/subunit
MYRTQPFVVSAYSGFGEAGACNQRFRTLLDWGAEQILVALDLPTQCGYDSDHEMSTGEVGQVGVAIDSLADMEALFDGIDIRDVKRIGTLGNSLGPVVLALFAALGRRRGVGVDDHAQHLQVGVLGPHRCQARRQARAAGQCDDHRRDIARCAHLTPGTGAASTAAGPPG